MVGQAQETTGDFETREDKKRALISKLLIKGEKKRETLGFIGFVMSLGGLAVSFFGTYYTGVLPIIELYFAFQGYYSKKKFYTKLTIILVIINILIIVVESLKLLIF